MTKIVRLPLLFLGIAAALWLFLKFMLPLLAYEFAGLGIEIPGWIVRLFPSNTAAGLFVMAAAALTVIVILAIVIRRSAHASKTVALPPDGAAR